MRWTDIDESEIRQHLDSYADLGRWTIRSLMLDRHESLSTVLVRFLDGLTLMCGIDLEVYGEEEESCYSSLWWLDDDGKVIRFDSEALIAAPSASVLTELLFIAITACEQKRSPQEGKATWAFTSDALIRSSA